MSVAIVKDFDAKMFELNGIQYVRNFIAVKTGSYVTIRGAYDSRFGLIGGLYSEFIVNGITYGSAGDLVSVLSAILFVKDELIMTGPSESTNNRITAIFSNIYGTWINDPTSAGFGIINLSLVNAVNGGICALYYKGGVITKDTFSGGVIVFLSGENILNELCMVYITYDEGSGSFIANIQAGYTGDLPTGGNDITPPLKMTINSVVETSSDIIPPLKMTINDILFSDEDSPSIMIINSIL